MTAEPAIIESTGTGSVAPQARPPAAGGWDMVVLGRQGNPPLRFRGRIFSQHVADSLPDGPLRITLWERQKGGFVVTHSLPGREGSATHAVSAISLSEAADYLEGFCVAGSGGSTDTIFVQSLRTDAVFEAIQTLCDRSLAFRLFRQLAGDALAQWDEAEQTARAQGMAEREVAG